jgi:hypothetical protein
MIAAHTLAGASLIFPTEASLALLPLGKARLAFVSLAFKTMKDFASFFFVTMVFSAAAMAIMKAPDPAADHEGLARCVKLHPERYCRIANGFPVPIKP